MDAEENILITKPPKKNPLYPSFVPCKHCGFDLWSLLNYHLVIQAIKDRHKFGDNIKNKKKKKKVTIVDECSDVNMTSDSCTSESDSDE